MVNVEQEQSALLDPVYTNLKKEHEIAHQNHLGSFEDMLKPGSHPKDAGAIGLNWYLHILIQLECKCSLPS